jgi:alpha-L-fucosidase
MVYFDDFGVPFGSSGLEALAHYYAKSAEWHGKVDVVVTAKQLTAYQRRGLMEDIERGYSDHLRDEPWQTCTCIGDWHYNRQRFLDKSYVPAPQVVQRLCDVVSKNGNLLLSIPVRGNGTIDSEEEKIVAGITRWMAVNGAAIHGSRPWRIYGEGPTKLDGGMFGESKVAAFKPEDVRFTVKNGALHMAMLQWPTAPVRVPSLGTTALRGARIARASLLGGGEVAVEQQADGAVFTLPRAGADQFVPVLRLEGAGLV